MPNPYDPQNPAKPDYFGGRIEALQIANERLDRAFRSNQSGGILVYGHRGVGKSSLLKKCLSVRKIIKENNFTTMIYLNQTLHLRQAWRDFLFFKLCGIKKIIGLSLREGGYHYLYDAQKKIFESERCRLARQIKLLGEVDWRDPNIMNLNIIDTELQKARAFLPHDFLSNPFIVCSIGTKLEMKDWGQANWIALIAALTKQYSNYGMVFIGVSDEYERSAELLNSWNGKTLNLCGKLSVRESAAVLSFARLFFGHDSGPMHLAAAVGTQCVAIFSRHAKPGCWFPFGKQHIVLYPKPGETILNIRVDSVLNEVQRVLEA